MYRMHIILCLILLITLTGITDADVVTDWNNCTLDIIKITGSPPTLSTHALAMVHIAVYDAVNTIYQSYDPYYTDIDVQTDVSPEASAASAAYEILRYIFPEYTSVFNMKLNESISHIQDGQPKELGISLGKQVAEEIILLRRFDGWDRMVTYDPEIIPGVWRPTPPGYVPPVGTNWGQVTPFAMLSQSQLRPGPPPDLKSREYSKAVEEVAAMGSDCSQMRTPDQTEIAYFWADDYNSVSPPGRWNIVARIIAENRRNTLYENARLFALLNITLADAAVCTWDCKYTYDLWRPITAIREADTDNNPKTKANPDWNPLLITPAFPEYTSGHSAFGAAAAKIIAYFFGTDRIQFTLESTSPFAGPRSYKSLSSAARENGQSRIYGGIHFSFGNAQSMKIGREVADYVWKNYLLNRSGAT